MLLQSKILEYDFGRSGKQLNDKKMLPIGIEFFDDMIRQNFYYVDKTGMIAELLQNRGMVNLFTRPSNIMNQ